MATTTRILMVCLGNICRSPTAEGILRHQLVLHGVNNVDVDSAGTGNWHVGDPPDPRTLQHAKARGYDLSMLRARQIVVEDFAAFDHVLAMDDYNLSELHARCPQAHQHKLQRFLDVIDDATAETIGRVVVDPYKGGPADFERVIDVCEAGAAAWLKRLGVSPKGG